MRITVDGVRFGVSFRHAPGPPGRMAQEIVMALAPHDAEERKKLGPDDMLMVANVVQTVLDQHGTWRHVSCPSCRAPDVIVRALPRAGRRARGGTTTCTIWKGEERPWDDETKALKPGAEAQILVSYTAECSVNDRFSRASGRKVAFYKALGPRGLAMDAETRKRWMTALKMAYNQLRKHSKDAAAKKATEATMAKAKEMLALAPPDA